MFYKIVFRFTCLVLSLPKSQGLSGLEQRIANCRIIGRVRGGSILDRITLSTTGKEGRFVLSPYEIHSGTELGKNHASSLHDFKDKCACFYRMSRICHVQFYPGLHTVTDIGLIYKMDFLKGSFILPGCL